MKTSSSDAKLLDQLQPVPAIHSSRYNTHANLLDVDLGELDAGVLVLELGEVGANDLAGSAPGGPEVDDGGLGRGDLGNKLVTILRNVRQRSAWCCANSSRALGACHKASSALVAYRSS